MQLLKELFTTDVGLLSAAVLLFVLVMGGYYIRYFVGHMHADEAKNKQ